MTTKAIITKISAPVTLVFIWLFLSYIVKVDTRIFPKPYDVLDQLNYLLFDSKFYLDIGTTFYRWLTGFFLGVIAGVPIGILMGAYKKVNSFLTFFVEFFRSIPVTAMFPLFLLTLGIGDSSKIAMVFTATIFVVILNTVSAVHSITSEKLFMAKVFGASSSQIFKTIIIPSSMTGIFLGARTALSLSLIVVIISEMFIGTKYGLGQRIFDAYSSNLVEELYLVLIIIGLIGYFSNISFMFFERYIIWWDRN